MLEHFNKAFESKARLGIMSVLIVNESLSFNALKDLLQLTDGNLATHLRALEEQGYIDHRKFRARRGSVLEEAIYPRAHQGMDDGL